MNKFFKSLAVFMLFSLVLFAVSCTATPEINSVDSDAFAGKSNGNGNNWDASKACSWIAFYSDSPFTIQIPAKSWDGTLEYYSYSSVTYQGSWNKINGAKTLRSSYVGYTNVGGKFYRYCLKIRGSNNTTITGGESANGWILDSKIESISGGIQALLDYGKVASKVTANQFAYIFGDVEGHKNLSKTDFASVGYRESISKIGAGSDSDSDAESFPTSEPDTARLVGGYGPNKVKDVVSLGYVSFESLAPFSVEVGGIGGRVKNEYSNTKRVKPFSYDTVWTNPVFEFNTSNLDIYGFVQAEHGNEQWTDVNEYENKYGFIEAGWNGSKYQIKFRGTQVYRLSWWKVKGQNVEISGDLRDLLDYKNHDDILANAALSFWLDGQKAITKLPNDIIIPYTNKYGSQYLYCAFRGTTINVAPNIKAERLSNAELQYAFRDCDQLFSGGILDIDYIDVDSSAGYAISDLYRGCYNMVNPGVINIKSHSKTGRYMYDNVYYIESRSLKALPYLEAEDIKQVGSVFGYRNNNAYSANCLIKYSPVKTAECPNLYIKLNTPMPSYFSNYCIFAGTGYNNLSSWYNYNNDRRFAGATEVYTNFRVMR